MPPPLAGVLDSCRPRADILEGRAARLRGRETMRAVAEGIEAMGREEAAYWLGMAMHRKRPRRVLTALRTLLTAPPARRRRR